MAKKYMESWSKEALTTEQRIQLIGVKNVLTLDEAALYTGMTARNIYKRCCLGTIPYYKSNGGGFNYFKKAELDACMTEQDMLDGRSNGKTKP